MPNRTKHSDKSLLLFGSVPLEQKLIVLMIVFFLLAELVLWATGLMNRENLHHPQVLIFSPTATNKSGIGAFLVFYLTVWVCGSPPSMQL